jgi:hypothetical protein
VNRRRQEQQGPQGGAASRRARPARRRARLTRADKRALLATRFATRTSVVRAARAVAELAASGHEPRLAAALERFAGPFNSLRVYMADAVKAGVAVYEGVEAGGACTGRAPALSRRSGEELAAAWEAARVLPPQSGTVRVGGHLYRVVDGEALGTVPGGDWLLLRGGRAVSKDGTASGRWEVVNG